MTTIATICMLTTIAFVSLIFAITAIKSWADLKKEHSALTDKNEFAESQKKLANDAEMGASATVYASIPYIIGEYKVEMPVTLIGKSLDGDNLRFALDYSRLPDIAPLNDENFQEHMEFKLNSWYPTHTNVVTWVPKKVITELKLSDKSKTELKYLIEYSEEIPVIQKDIIKSILKLK